MPTRQPPMCLWSAVRSTIHPRLTEDAPGSLPETGRLLGARLAFLEGQPRSPPDGSSKSDDDGDGHDVELDPQKLDPYSFNIDACLNAFPPDQLLLLTISDQNQTMSTTEDETGLNGRLRPRKSLACPQNTKTARKSDTKAIQNKKYRTSTPSKVSPQKHDDLANKSDFSSTPQFLCSFCEKRFGSQKTAVKHVHRMHLTQAASIECLFCKHTEPKSAIIRHMVDSHPNQYFACLDCQTRFPSTSELAEHKLNVCDKLRVTSPKKLRKKAGKVGKKNQKQRELKQDLDKVDKDFQGDHGFNGIVISCEVKPSQMHDNADIEDKITTNVILPSSKCLPQSAGLDKGAVIQWNKHLPPNFSFNNADADQILSRLGVVHRSPRTGESTRRDWSKTLDNFPVKFEKCFDTTFYSKVASNVQENLAKFLDGSFNFNPDPDKAIKTRKAKNSVVINTAEGFPILLACEQYSRSVFDGYMPRAIAPKHKWKWDSLEYEKPLMSADQIKRDSHTNNCIITLVSSLDIWTQLRMRRKFEEKYGAKPIEKKTEKQNIIGKELKEILESREIPSPPIAVTPRADVEASSSGLEFPSTLGLTRAAIATSPQPQKAVLSGEWVRPRCYVCCACGAQTRDNRTLGIHISTQHPNAQVHHYEIVGEQLLNADILKHLYVPPSQVSNRTRPPRGFRECTKCQKSITLEDLHQHMLECAGDTPAVRRRQCRYRPFGVRKRRPRLPDDTARKKMRKNIRSKQRRQKEIIRSRSKIRSEVGDAETIRKMLADLPAKRHRVMLNPIHKAARPRRMLNTQRNKIIMKKRSAEVTHGGPRTIRSRVDKNAPSGGNNPEKIGSGQDDDDDEDNKPLKPKVQRLGNLRTRTRTNELPRTVAITKVKRRSIRVKQKNNPLKPDDSKADIHNISDKAMPKRIDVNQGACNTKENSGCDQKSSNNPTNQRNDENREGCNTRGNLNRNGSDNHDNRGAQPPAGPDRRNGNYGDNNAHVPTPNTPLKHSIEKLTASAQKHDKSVQFHSWFLVHQSCYNKDRHQPSDPIAQFESEAVASKIDKPPISSDKKQSIHEVTKNKPSKPKKGLNDCIAMLKNKLVESPTTGQVSVLCGSDEPISPLHLSPPLRPISQDVMMVSPGSDYLNKKLKNTGQSNNIQVGAEARPIVRYDQAKFAVPLPHASAVERRYSTEQTLSASRHTPQAERRYSTEQTPSASCHVSPAERRYSTEQTPSASRHTPPAERRYSSEQTPSASSHVSPAERRYSTELTPSASCHVSSTERRYSAEQPPSASRNMPSAERRYSTEQRPSASCHVSPVERRYSTEETPRESRHMPSAERRYSTEQRRSASCHVSPAERRYSTEQTPSASRHMPSAERRYSTEQTPSATCHVSSTERRYSTEQPPSASRNMPSAERRYSTEQRPSASCHVSPVERRYSTEETPSASRHMPSAERRYTTEQTPSTSRHTPPAERRYSSEQTPSTSRHMPSAERRYSTEQTPSTSRHVSPAERRYSTEQTPSPSCHMPSAERKHSAEQSPSTSHHALSGDRRYSPDQTPTISRRSSSRERNNISNVNSMRQRTSSSSSDKKPNLIYDKTDYTREKFGLHEVKTSDCGSDIDLLLPKSYRAKSFSARSPSPIRSGRSSVQSDCDRAHISKPLALTQLSARSGVDITLDDMRGQKVYENRHYSGRIDTLSTRPYDHTIDKLSAPIHLNYDPMKALQKVHHDAEKKISSARSLRYDQPVERIIAMQDLSYDKKIERMVAIPDANLYTQQVLGMPEYPYDQSSMLVYPESLITSQSLADVRPEGELYRSFRAEMDLYAKARVRSVLPPAHANADVDQDLPAPLDLSGKSVNDARRNESGTFDRFNDSMMDVVDLRVGTHADSRNDIVFEMTAGPSSTATSSGVSQSSSRVTRSSSQRTDSSVKCKVKYDIVDNYQDLPHQIKRNPLTSKDQLLVSVVKEGKLINSTVETNKVLTSENTLRVKPLNSLQSAGNLEASSINDIASVQNLQAKSVKHCKEKIAHGQDRVGKNIHYEIAYLHDKSMSVNAKTSPTNADASRLKTVQSLQEPIITVPYDNEYISPVYTIENSVPRDNFNTTAAITDTTKLSAAIKSYDSVTTGDHIGEKPEKYRKEKNESKESKTNVTIMDPDTAKKIAMLPRELVEILGTMPADHRNQLLNVLPQYVASTMASPLSLPDTVDTTLNQNKEDNGASNKSPTTELSITSLDKNSCHEKKIAESMHNRSNTTSSLVPARCNKDVKISQPVIVDTGKTTNFCVSEKNLSNQHPMPGSEHTTTSIRLIGLTDDKVYSGDTLKETRDMSCSLSLPLPAPPTLVTVDKSHRRKSNNEQTASLRAVRIRTQSDKQKELLPLKEPCSDDIPKLDMVDSQKELLALKEPCSNDIPKLDMVDSQKELLALKEPCLDEMPKLDVVDEKEVKISLVKQIQAVQRVGITSTQQENKTLYSNTLLTMPKPCEATSNTKDKNSKQSITTAEDPISLQSEDSMLITNPGLVATPDEYTILKNDTVESGKVPHPSVTSAQESNPIKQNNDEKLSDKTDNEANCDEADSEDDVSLAAIVKLKQRDTNITTTTRSLKKQKKERKVKNIKSTVQFRKPSKNKDSNVSSNIAFTEKKNDLIIIIHNNAIESKENSSFNAPNETTTVLINSHAEKKQETTILKEPTSKVEPQVQECIGKNPPSIKVKRKKDRTSKKDLSHDSILTNESKSSIESTVSMSPDRTDESLMTDNISGHNELSSSKPCLESSYVSINSEISETSTVEHFVAPLRRSMRGKSLITDDILNESTIPPTAETATDQKVPVTKKQLIFYKLSLDEEKLSVNVSKSSDFSFDSNISCTNEHDIIGNKQEVSADSILQKGGLVEQSSDDLYQKESVDGNVEQINKPIKRKKIPNRRKPKKQKNMLGVHKSQEITSINMPDTDTCNEDATIDTPNKNSDEHIIELPFDQKHGTEDNLEEQSCSLVGKRKHDLDNTDSSSVKRNKSTMQNTKIINEKDQKSIPAGDSEKLSKARSTTCYDMPKAARQTRSKSTSTKPSAVYDPYDIDLDDMIECEPLKKIFRSNTKTIRSIKTKPSKHKVTVVKKISVETEVDPTVSDLFNLRESSQDRSKDTAANKTPSSNAVDLNINTDMDKPDTFPNIVNNQANIDISVVTEEEYTKKVIMSDSDDSSKSDVPLNRYIQNKNKKQPASSKRRKNKTRVAKTKKSTKQKRILSRKLAAIKKSKNSEHVSFDKKSEEQLRSEQFMESFGFFSERKPRKSNLLASKKIAETFHTANESDHIFLKRITKKRQSNEIKSKKKGKTLQQGAASAKKRGRKQETNTKPEQYFCDCCRKGFRRADNLMRHRMTFIHASNLPGFASDIGLTVEKPNYCVAFKEQMDKFNALTESLKGKKKSKVKLPTMQDLVADAFKAVRQQQLIARGLSVDEALFIDCCELLKESNSETPKSEIGPLPNKKKVCYGACKPPPKSDSDVDPITARSILESEVRIKNFENDLISCFKDAAEGADNVRQNMEHQQSASVTFESNQQETDETFSFSNCKNSDFDGRKEDNKQQHSEIFTFENYRRKKTETVTSSSCLDPDDVQKSYDETHSQSSNLTLFHREIIETLTSFNYHGAHLNPNGNKKPQQNTGPSFEMNHNFQDPFVGLTSYENENHQKNEKLFFEKLRRKKIETVTSANYKDPSAAQNFRDGEEDCQTANLALGNCKDNEGHQQNESLVFESNVGDRLETVSKKSKDQQSASLVFESNVGDRIESDAGNSNDKQRNATFESNVGDTIETFARSQYQYASPDRKSKDEEECSTDETINKKNQNFQYKEKMYPDLKNIDMFEDKFDKIKRKCRSQAAAAKQSTATMVSEMSGQKSEVEEVRKKKKSDKKKVKKNSNKGCQSTVLTKGALKGFDGVKMSIPTSSTVPIHETSKKKRKKSSKKKRDKKAAISNRKYDYDYRAKDCAAQKKVDVYEFMDIEEELLELRPSTVMERFKNIHYESTASTSKYNRVVNEPDNSSESASDGDDFVYMSDDYVASEEETENSLLSEIGNVKGETKKAVAQSKRKESTEKNAVMGKIFKHNALRTEKKSVKIVDTVKPQANLDQLFDSLLKDDPAEDIESDKNEHSLMSSKYEESTSQSMSPRSEKYTESKTLSLEMYDYPSPKKDIKPRLVASAVPKSDVLSVPSTSKKAVDSDLLSDDFNSSPTDDETFPQKRHDKFTKKYDSDRDDVVKQFLKSGKIMKNAELASDFEIESIPLLEDTGVALQRARRKCTVGKQNVLAETWSSESEVDGGPVRASSAVSAAPTSHRKKKMKKVQVGGRRRGNKEEACKKQDVSSGTPSSAQTGGSREEWALQLADELEADEQTRREREQHGWIVGGSHKKLVTMLAHAKGRKRNEQHSLD